MRITVNEKKDGYDTSVWMIATAGDDQPHQLTNGKHDSSPRWSPDGNYLCFVRAVEKDGKPEPPQLSMLQWLAVIRLLSPNCRKARAARNGRLTARQSFSPARPNPEDLAKQEKKKRKEEEQKRSAASTPSPSPSDRRRKREAQPSPSPNKSETDDEHESDIHVVTRAIYRSDDDGYSIRNVRNISGPSRRRTAPKKKCSRSKLTFGRFDEGNPFWSKEGAQIYFTSLHVDEPYYDLPKTELYSIPVNGGEATKVTTFDMDVHEISLSPDGKQIAFAASMAQPVNSYTQPDLWVCDLARDAKPKNLTETFDYDFGSGVFGDSAPPRAGGGAIPLWSPDGKSLLDVYGKEGRTILARFDAMTGAASDLTSGNQAVVRFRQSSDGAKIVCTVSNATRINDLFVMNNAGRDLKQLTHINDKLFSQLDLTEPEEISYQSFDGKKIQAWVQKPPSFDKAKKYPLILDIHGGPHAAYGFIFEHEFQWMAAKGYVVLYPNPRGSTTYGQEFGNIIQYDYPGRRL